MSIINRLADSSTFAASRLSDLSRSVVSSSLRLFVSPRSSLFASFRSIVSFVFLLTLHPILLGPKASFSWTLSIITAYTPVCDNHSNWWLALILISVDLPNLDPESDQADFQFRKWIPKSITWLFERFQRLLKFRASELQRERERELPKSRFNWSKQAAKNRATIMMCGVIALSV